MRRKKKTVMKQHKTTETLEGLLERVETWPAEAQEELVQAVIDIESRYGNGGSEGRLALKPAATGAPADQAIDAFGWTGRRASGQGN